MGTDNQYLDINKEAKYHCFFNGDADGIFSVLQFIKSGFIMNSLFTSYKRDHSLLRHGQTLYNTNILVFDLELSKNMKSVRRLLENGCTVIWFDHHGNGEENIFFEYINFFPNIDISPTINTSLIVYKLLKNPELLIWAIVGLFGDNIDNIALYYCKKLNLSSQKILTLTELGKLINYNSYGECINDLIMNPMDILNQIKQFKDPFCFYKETNIAERLKISSTRDMELALSYCKKDNIIFLPNTHWAKRVYGMLASFLVKKYQTKPIAILVDIDEDNYLVSVRAPLNKPTGAGNLCRLFNSGGGRAAAGGVNKLNKGHLDKFISAFEENW